MRELALHLLDISENSVSAQAQNITIIVEEDTQADTLKMSVIDDGRGMDSEMVARVIDPFVTSRTTRKVGLGIPLLKEAAEMCNGYLTIQSEVGKGTRVDIQFQRSHIDRMPLGDLAGTMLTLIVGSPQVHWVFRYIVNGKVFEFDDAPVKQELDGIPMTEPTILSYIRNWLEQGITEIQPAD